MLYGIGSFIYVKLEDYTDKKLYSVPAFIIGIIFFILLSLLHLEASLIYKKMLD
jgi:hypothetical protein